jgi:hypothetical protein
MAAVPGEVMRELVPPGARPVPAGFALRRERITRAIPHVFELAPGLTLVLIVPTGLAAAWRDAPPSAVVTNSDPQFGPALRGDDVATAPVRLLLRAGVRETGIAPLVAGLRQRLPSTGRAVVELQVRGWVLHAGTLVGPGEFGSKLELAWRAFGPGPAA